MSKSNHSIMFLGKKNDDYCSKALRFCQLNFDQVEVQLGEWGDPWPENTDWEGDYIISYLSRWVVPEKFLEKTKIAAINFHPATPDYPGIGCNNFALYEGALEYGVTCHHMNPSVDTGDIIAVKRFPILQSDSVRSLLNRTYKCQLALFYEIMKDIIQRKELRKSQEKWTREPFTRKEFNELRKIKLNMSKEETIKRIRATDYGVWKPYIELHGFCFELRNKPED